MPEILVIADDFTGAAEMGGIAHLFGLSATVVTELSEPTLYPEDVVILDTNSRRLDPASAMGKVTAMLKYLNQSDFKLTYKKVDSVLRGPVESEIKGSSVKACILSMISQLTRPISIMTRNIPEIAPGWTA